MAKIIVFAEIIFAPKNVPFWSPNGPKMEAGGVQGPQKMGLKRRQSEKTYFLKNQFLGEKMGSENWILEGPKRSYKGKWAFPGELQPGEPGLRGRVGKGKLSLLSKLRS